MSFEIDNLMDYFPLFDEDPQFLIDEIKSELSGHLSDNDLIKIQNTYEFARDSHKGQRRHSGEPYIIHPVKTAEILLKIKPDVITIQGALLHDVIEDTSYTYQDIKEYFGKEVADICLGLEKVSGIKYKGEDRFLETLKKTFLVMGKDLRVIFIKLADRTHNIQTLHYHPKFEKQKKIAQETVKIYVPIAQRLGLYGFQIYLENGSFKILNNDEYERINNYISKNYAYSSFYEQKGKQHITKLLLNEGIKNFNVKSRIKSPYRIYKKLEKYGTRNITKIFDIVAFRIITDNIASCYHIFGLIHSKYSPIFKKLKDYIGLSKSNGYQSLHTTILGLLKFPVEIQIRTNKMDRVAEYGLAAHYFYKETGSSTITVSKKQTDWIKELQKIVNSYQEDYDKERFKNELNIEVFKQKVFVYTIEGNVVELPRGSSVLDFAFKLYETDQLFQIKNIILNDKIVPLDYKVNTGDIVKVLFYNNKETVSHSWLSYLHSPISKKRLNDHLNNLKRKNLILQGKKKLSAKLLQYGLPKLSTKLCLITKDYTKKKLEEFYYSIGIGNKKITDILKKFYNFEESVNAVKKTEKVNIYNTIKKAVIIDTDKEVDYTFCNECRPEIGDKIIAKTSRNGIKIHNINCKSINFIRFDNLIEAHWKNEKINKYILKIDMEIINKPGSLLNILKNIEEYGINLYDIGIVGLSEEIAKVSISLEFSMPAKISFLLKDLKNKEKLLNIINKEII